MFAEPLETNQELSGNSIPPLHMYDRISMFHTLTPTLEDDQFTSKADDKWSQLVDLLLQNFNDS